MDITTALSITAPLAILAADLRHRCCYCSVKHPTDGRGPILSGELVSDGICPVALVIMNAELDAMEAGR